VSVKRRTHARLRLRSGLREGALIALVAALASAAPRAGAANKATILLTMQNLGYIQACSCGREALGGLGRRATILDGLRKKHPGALLIDGGDLVRLDTQPPAIRTIIQSMESMKYDAVRVGVFDAQSQWAASLMRASKLPLLDAGFTPKLFERSGVRIAVFDVPMPKPRSEYPLDELTPKMGLAFTDARKHADVIVAMTQMSAPETEQFVNGLVKADMAPDIVVSDTLASPELKQVGPVMEVNSGVNGKYVSVFTAEAHPGGKPTLQHESVPVLLDTAERPDVEKLVNAYLQAVDLGIETVKIPEFDSSQYCASCHDVKTHTDAFAVWLKTRHSHALKTLQEDSTNPPKGSAARSPQCLSCHVGSYKRFQALDPSSTGVECITCHTTEAHTKKGFVSEAVCLECHDKDNSPHFDFAAYTAKIRHWDDKHDAEFQKFIAQQASNGGPPVPPVPSPQPATAKGVTGVVVVGFVIVVVLASGVAIYRLASGRNRQ